MKRLIMAAGLVASMASAACAQQGFGAAGLLSGDNKEDLPPITLSSGMPISEGPWTLKSGTYYEFEIIGDGSQELTLDGAEFFRAIWIDEIVVNGLEIRPLGLASVEFDEAGEMEIGFVAVVPGRYYIRIPGTTGETQRMEITIQ